MSDKDDKKAKLNVVPIVKQPEVDEPLSDPSPEVISLLKELYEQALAGDITEVMTIVSYYDGTSIEGFWAGVAEEPDKMIGQIERTKMRYLMWTDEEFMEDDD